ncbi:conjugal transfer protein [Enterococcus faecalis]|uniref:cysteine-rich KTR domain-containing protein n=1 Tax=Enterococcus faecalis TaxID=1351 RepID=UPI0027ED70B0|nr:cysteine-rich KTR domain-containing protein [Enterococcus faecalis]EKZ0407293.1 conjugal transfer protein [Enterococcus faecalis]MDT2086713.1 cysteine-rich KTR domain-containing protein [Enterococcus faecalis]
MKKTWLLCPNCNNKTRVQVYDSTILIRFPLYCPKCKKETIISVKLKKITVIKDS